MDTGALKTFAKDARRTLRDQVTARLALVRDEAHPARREDPSAFAQLEAAIAKSSAEQVIEKVAYTWFNRFCALRFMDANGYGSVRAVSPADAQTRPELLAEAMSGVISAEIAPDIATRVGALLDGRTPSRDPQGEAYRLLLVATCNHWHGTMPFMFETIADYTELLMPEDLLSPDGILARMRGVMTEEACSDVEIIGWLYQFYISEKKDEVFAGLKKNRKITPENIPAATQLFTPHWIVRYLVENSLGRLWLLNRPHSNLRARMDYYIPPETPESDFLRIDRPEDIRICDPACGSGHMLTYAFDLLHAIYEEEGHDAAEIPGLILTHNLYGIEIDERAGALAAFALVMKATARRRRFLRRLVQPNICVLENVAFRPDELEQYASAIGPHLFTPAVCETLGQFTEAKNFGSLIRPAFTDWAVADAISALDFASNLYLRDIHTRVTTVLRMAIALSPRYHVVVANPPYMGGKGMNPGLVDWLKAEYPEAKTDLMTCFMSRMDSLLSAAGIWGMINIPTWMFISSFGELRSNLLTEQTLLSLIHLGRGLFGADFGTVAFVVHNHPPSDTSTAIYRRLFEKHVDVRPAEEIRRLFLDQSYGRYYTNQSVLTGIPGKPIAYWLSPAMQDIFIGATPLSSIVDARQGISTSDNPRFLRLWWEVELNGRGEIKNTGLDFRVNNTRWALYNKAGEFRKWAGNQSHVIWWRNDGQDIKNLKPKSVIRSPEFYFKESVSWSDYTASANSFRHYDPGFVFDTGAHSAFSEEKAHLNELICFGNSKIFNAIKDVINPTMHFHAGNLLETPRLPINAEHISKMAPAAINLTRDDWAAYETSWDFTTLPLLASEHRQATVAETYVQLRAHWASMTHEMRDLEEENNRVFILAYKLADELTPEVPLAEITLTCNPAYRYGGDKSVDALEALLLADTMRELVSYAVGCMFGRYSLDAPGLVIASQGEGLDVYAARVPEASFAPDIDNVIPVLDGEWFADDITQRFRRFLRTTFGDAHFADNLAFVEGALGKDIRKYFTRDFYNDHVKRYRKRPIYWLFSSPNGTFNALIYLQRYRADTVSVVLNDYLREFRAKLAAHRVTQTSLSINPDETPARKAKALKEIDLVSRQITEIDDWERGILFPLASQRLEIDLDDGVKVNYPKFGAALKPIKGLEEAEG